MGGASGKGGGKGIWYDRTGKEQLPTFALPTNSRMTSRALCSKVSRTNVNGLALSRRLSNFWRSKSACERE